jgi:hypothetical protein
MFLNENTLKKKKTFKIMLIISFEKSTKIKIIKYDGSYNI